MTSTEPANQSPLLMAYMRKLAESLGNDYSDNFDARRFGPERRGLRERVRSALLAQGILTSGYVKTALSTAVGHVAPHMAGLEWLYANLADQESRDLLVLLLTYRALGYRKVKLPLSDAAYWSRMEALDRMLAGADSISLGFEDWRAYKADLSSIGYPINLYFTAPGIFTDFVAEQYRCRTETGAIEVKAGDTVIDCGGCYADTALYFAAKAGPQGKVFSFEFLPDNLSVFERNAGLNPELAGRIQLVPHPVWSSSDKPMFVVACGPGTHVTDQPGNEDALQVSTLTIDDLVQQRGLDRVDFIKMDIEGAEGEALKGAVETLKSFRPKLAIAVYHRLSDFWTLTQFIDGLGLGYKFHLRHFTIHAEETILFASVD